MPGQQRSRRTVLLTVVKELEPYYRMRATVNADACCTRSCRQDPARYELDSDNHTNMARVAIGSYRQLRREESRTLSSDNKRKFTVTSVTLVEERFMGE